VDPHSIVVLRERPNGAVARISPWFSESLYYGNRGTISIPVQAPRRGGRWALLFRERRKDGSLLPFPEYIPPVGVGDELLLNSGRFAPMSVPGMHASPIAVDWDMDGRVDILSTSHYSNTLGMPWSGVFVFRNIGSPARPRFGPPLRLYADGVDEEDSSRPGSVSSFAPKKGFISEYYLRADVFNWFGEKYPDLVTASAQSSFIKVYRNTGKKDRVGLPILKLALRIPKPREMDGITGLRVLDWDGEGRPSIVLGSSMVDHGLDRGRLVLLWNHSDDPLSRGSKKSPSWSGKRGGSSAGCSRGASTSST